MSGATELAYLGFEASDLGAWERFATELLGLVLVERRADGALAFTGNAGDADSPPEPPELTETTGGMKGESL